MKKNVTILLSLLLLVNNFTIFSMQIKNSNPNPGRFSRIINYLSCDYLGSKKKAIQKIRSRKDLLAQETLKKELIKKKKKELLNIMRAYKSQKIDKVDESISPENKIEAPIRDKHLGKLSVIPNEILYEILKYNDEETLQSIASLNKLFRELISKTHDICIKCTRNELSTLTCNNILDKKNFAIAKLLAEKKLDVYLVTNPHIITKILRILGKCFSKSLGKYLERCCGELYHKITTPLEDYFTANQDELHPRKFNNTQELQTAVSKQIKSKYNQCTKFCIPLIFLTGALIIISTPITNFFSDPDVEIFNPLCSIAGPERVFHEYPSLKPSTKSIDTIAYYTIPIASSLAVLTYKHFKKMKNRALKYINSGKTSSEKKKKN